MTLPAPNQRTWAPEDIVTAAMMNANVRDAVNFLAEPPLFVGYQQNPQSIANAAFVPVALDTTTVDTYAGHSNTTNNERYTAAVAGWYLIGGMVGFDGNVTGKRIAAIAVNGTVQMAADNDPATASPINAIIPASAVYLHVGDYVSLEAYQTSGAALLLNGGSTYQPTITVVWLHA